MSKPISYQVGYFLADKPRLRVTLFCGFFVVAFLATYPWGDSKNTNLEPAKTSSNQPVGCAGERLQNYQTLVQKNAFWEASLQVAPCEVLKDGNDYTGMRREAEKKHYENEIVASKNDLARKYAAVAKLIDEKHPVDTKLTQQREKYLEAERKKAAVAEAKYKKSRGVVIGMTEQDVLASSWGKPRHINTTTRASGTSAQWVYNGSYLYFKNGILETIQN